MVDFSLRDPGLHDCRFCLGGYRSRAVVVPPLPAESEASLETAAGLNSENEDRD